MKFLAAGMFALAVTTFAASGAFACPYQSAQTTEKEVLASAAPGGPQSQPVLLPTKKAPESDES
jgi:hypothetical protein